MSYVKIRLLTWSMVPKFLVALTWETNLNSCFIINLSDTFKLRRNAEILHCGIISMKEIINEKDQKIKPGSLICNYERDMD